MGTMVSLLSTIIVLVDASPFCEHQGEEALTLLPSFPAVLPLATLVCTLSLNSNSFFNNNCIIINLGIQKSVITHFTSVHRLIIGRLYQFTCSHYISTPSFLNMQSCRLPVFECTGNMIGGTRYIAMTSSNTIN